MSAVDIATARLKTEEGFRGTLYVDTTGHPTIGYGFNVSAGISQYAAGALLTAQVQELDESLQQYSWYSIDAVRQSVLLDIALNQGILGLLHYPKMLAAIGAGDWTEAAAQCTVADAQLNETRYAPLRALLLSG
jgi:lysozyme